MTRMSRQEPKEKEEGAAQCAAHFCHLFTLLLG